MAHRNCTLVGVGSPLMCVWPQQFRKPGDWEKILLERANKYKSPVSRGIVVLRATTLKGVPLVGVATKVPWRISPRRALSLKPADLGDLQSGNK